MHWNLIGSGLKLTLLISLVSTTSSRDQFWLLNFQPRPLSYQMIAQSRSEPVVIVTFGDSTTAPRGSLKTFAEQLKERLQGAGHQLCIVNAGIAGNNTRQARERLARDVISQQPHIVTILFGINDSAVDVYNGATQPRVSLREYENNLRWITKQLQDKGIQSIILTPNPIAWTPQLKALYGKPPYRSENPDGWNVYLTNYAKAARRVATECRVPLVDTYGLFEIYSSHPKHNLNDLMLDGMHPNDHGHSIIADHLSAVIRTMTVWKQASPRNPAIVPRTNRCS